MPNAPAGHEKSALLPLLVPGAAAAGGLGMGYLLKKLLDRRNGGGAEAEGGGGLYAGGRHPYHNALRQNPGLVGHAVRSREGGKTASATKKAGLMQLLQRLGKGYGAHMSGLGSDYLGRLKALGGDALDIGGDMASDAGRVGSSLGSDAMTVAKRYPWHTAGLGAVGGLGLGGLAGAGAMGLSALGGGGGMLDGKEASDAYAAGYRRMMRIKQGADSCTTTPMSKKKGKKSKPYQGETKNAELVVKQAAHVLAQQGFQPADIPKLITHQLISKSAAEIGRELTEPEQRQLYQRVTAITSAA